MKSPWAGVNRFYNQKGCRGREAAKVRQPVRCQSLYTDFVFQAKTCCVSYLGIISSPDKLRANSKPYLLFAEQSHITHLTLQNSSFLPFSISAFLPFLPFIGFLFGLVLILFLWVRYHITQASLDLDI